MAKFKVLVLTEATEGKEAEFSDYYENLHLDEVLSTTGLLSAQRFKLAATAGDPPPLEYLALYDAEAESAASVLQNLNETRSRRQQSDSLNFRTAKVWVFEEIGARHEK